MKIKVKLRNMLRRDKTAQLYLLPYITAKLLKETANIEDDTVIISVFGIAVGWGYWDILIMIMHKRYK